jgi:hypothetical protein|tara:strand:+ start:2260 stop:2448 length:189 start_codon:yes stop_codon:yes gene_type:complete
MSKNFWQRDRKSIYRGLVKEYQREGYDYKESKRYAKQETDEIMSDKESFVDTLISLEEEQSS